MSKLPFSTGIVTHAVVETCVLGGVTYYLSSRISALEKRVQELEELLIKQAKISAQQQAQPFIIQQPQESRIYSAPPPQPPQPIQHHQPPLETTIESDELPPSPPSLERQNATIRENATIRDIPIEIQSPQPDLSSQLKDIDAEVEKEIAELNLG